eukprot:PITA_18177
MILLSWNCRGLASKPKKLALKEMVMSSKPDFILLQETLGKSIEIEIALMSLLPGWRFTALDSVGHSGGLGIGYREGRVRILNQWGMEHAMGTEIRSSDFGFPLTILNIYGPCQGRMNFWNDLLSKDIMGSHNMVLGGDLNFSIGSAEAWGPAAREDPLSDFFLNAITTHNLIDVNLIKLKPTWRNRRVGEARIAKRLDRFLLSEDLTTSIPMFRQWVGEGENSDHFPIFLEISKHPRKPAAPFKFNASWLQEKSYEKLFSETWNHLDGSSQEGKGFQFMENFKKLKKATIEWANTRKERQKEELTQINEELQRMECTETDGYESQESKEKILLLEKQRDQILLAREEEWRLKSRAVWLKVGDENTKFFHNYAKGRKNSNTIWKLKNEEGEEANTFEELSVLGRNHFQNLFADQGEITIAEVIRTAQCFPRYVEEEEAKSLMNEVTKEEVECVIKSMAKDKSLGSDGWTIELFQHFFDQIGTELTEVVEESRKRGEVYSPFNATFIALIPKKETLDTFEDFRPISLCNCIYKIIAKVITIHEAIGVAQETIHSIKQMKRKGAVIKIDLAKAYDRINWVYIRMLLTHLGFKYDFIRWIMGCISNVSFAILINGAASPFFKSFRGLRQGCPLSPLLFLLVAEGLSHLIRLAKREGAVKGLEVAVNMFITHLLFVDDILLFTNGNLNEIRELKNILDLFMKATGMQINYRKSQLITEGLNRLEKNQISSLLPFDVLSMENPFKYLGFLLKPNAYRKQDWNWLVAKIEARISHWSFKWLSRAGRLTLIKSVLLAMPVYWVALTWVLKRIRGKINIICNRFLWAGSKEDFVLPWVAWDKVARPKEWGGWGIKNLTDFSISLAAKSSWRIIKMENLWTKVIKRKYIDPTPLEEWIRNPAKKEKNASVVWKAIVEAFKVIEQALAWQIGNGENLRIGKDPWVGCNGNFALSPGLIRHLESKGILHLRQIEKIGFSSIWGQAWKSGEELGLHPASWNEWKVYTEELSRSNVRIRDRQDQLVWAHAENGSYSPKFGYKFLMTRKGWGDPEWWSNCYGNSNAQQKPDFSFGVF